MSGGKKEIFRNLVSFGIVDILGILIPLITMPLLTRAIGAEEYGRYILLLSMVMFGHTIIDYSINFIGVRDVSRNIESENKIKKCYVKYQSVRIVFCFLYIVLFLTYSKIFLSDINFKYSVFYGIPYLIGYTLTSAWFFQGIGKTHILMIVTLIGKIINLFVILFFVREQKDVIFVMMSTTWTLFLSGIILFLYLKIKFHIRIFCYKNLFQTLKSGLNVFIGILAPNFYNSIPIIAMGTISNPIDFAKFAIANRLCSVVITCQNIVSKSIYPILSRASASYTNRILIGNLIISIPIVLFISLFGNEFLTLFLGKGFMDGNIYLLILSVGMIFLGIANTYGDGFLLPKGYDKEYRNVSIIVSIISSVISYILIYNYSLIGGSIALTSARLFFAIGFLFTYLKIKRYEN